METLFTVTFQTTFGLPMQIPHCNLNYELYADYVFRSLTFFN